MTTQAYSAQRENQYPSAVDSVPAQGFDSAPHSECPHPGNRKPRRTPNTDLSRLIAPNGKRRPKLIAGILDGLHWGLIQRRGGLYDAIARDACLAASPVGEDGPEHRKRRFRGDACANLAALAMQLVAHADAITGLVGVPRAGRGLVKLTIEEHIARAGLSASAGERAWKVLCRLGFAKIQTIRRKTDRGVRSETPTIWVMLRVLAGMCGLRGTFTKQLRRLRDAGASVARKGMQTVASALRPATAGPTADERRAVAEVAAERAREAARPRGTGGPPPGGWDAFLAAIGDT